MHIPLHLCCAIPAAIAALTAAPPAAARDKCIAVMQLVGVPANVAEAKDESGEDTNGDGQIWLNMGGGRMTGFIDCSDHPGASHGDMYEQNYATGETRRTGNSQASGQLGRKWFQDTARHNASSGSGSSGSSGGSNSRPDDSRPPQGGPPPAAKKKKPVKAPR